MIDLLAGGVVVLVSYLVVDRLLARYHTGSWWGRPSDVARLDENREL